MADFNEFRIQLRANDHGAGTWEIQLLSCPMPALIGPKGISQPCFTRRQLRRLRDQNGWPNLGELVQIGSAVWRSIMTPELAAALETCLLLSKEQCKSLQITVVAQGSDEPDENRASLDDPVRLAELPIEALYEDRQGFLAVDLSTPICRGLQAASDRVPQKIDLPLRLLVAVAAPADKPAAKVAEEVQAIQSALKPLSDPGGPLILDVCQQPTRTEIAKRVQSCHVFHFIGHGGFDVMGSDPTAQAYITLIRENGIESDGLMAYDLANMLRNTNVQLVVFTACASAVIRPLEEPYPIGAFNGMAQRLLSGISGVPAAVAMQFDMEEDAAVIFSQTFYQHLLAPNKTLAEVVTLARKEVAIRRQLGHRAWVTPVVYCRNQGGKAFELAVSPASNTTTPDRPEPANVDLPVLRDAMVGAFSEEELEDLCLDIERDLAKDGLKERVSLEMVGGKGKSGQIRELVLYLNRRGYLGYLVKAVLRKRPNLQY